MSEGGWWPCLGPPAWVVLILLKSRFVAMKLGARKARVVGGQQSLGVLHRILEKYIEKLQIGGFYRLEP